MAQSRSKRRRKHRGTQAGTIETPSHRSGKATASRATSNSRTRAQRQMKPPSWKSSAYKAGAAAIVFALLSTVVFHNKNSAPTIIITCVFVFFIYLPVAYWTDKAMYKRRLQKMQAGK